MVVNVIKWPSLQNPLTDFAEIWCQFLAGKGRPIFNFCLGLLSGFA